MHTPHRTPSQPVQAAKKATPSTERRATERRAPIELDVRSLRLVAGGADLPKKTW
jgi:hypothetical protein